MQPESQTGTINPAFAGYAAKYIRDASDDLQRVFDNLLEISGGDVPDATGYDRIRATRILYDRGFGKVTKNTPRTPSPVSERDSESEKSQNPTNQGSDNPGSEQGQTVEPVLSLSKEPALSLPKEPALSLPKEPALSLPKEPALSLSKGADLKNAPPGTSTHLVSQIEQKLDDLLGPVQSPEQPKPRTPLEIAEGFVPDIVRDSQYYVLEITDYGAKLADILMSIHEPDPENDTIKQCHRVTAGQMMIDRVLGPASNLQYDPDYAYDPAEDPYWAFRHPAEIDSQLTPEELKEADRQTRNFVEGMKKEDDGPCEDCEDDYLCEIHDPESEYYDDGNVTDEEIEIIARGMRNVMAYEDRLYFDPADGRLKLRPHNYIDDS